MEKHLTIRNSTAEFLIFQAQDKSQGVEVVYHDETIWATQKAMSVLFDCTTDNIGLHLKNIFSSGELKKESVTEKISATASDGNSPQKKHRSCAAMQFLDLRRDRDSNSGYPFGVYTLSRRAS